MPKVKPAPQDHKVHLGNRELLVPLDLRDPLVSPEILELKVILELLVQLAVLVILGLLGQKDFQARTDLKETLVLREIKANRDLLQQVSVIN